MYSTAPSQDVVSHNAKEETCDSMNGWHQAFGIGAVGYGRKSCILRSNRMRRRALRTADGCESFIDVKER